MIKVIYESDADAASRLRFLLCQETNEKPGSGRNPLTATDFNEQIDKLAQEAFDAGRAYERTQPRKS